uniref:non-specific serine/threonine protein kinase n=1 Tax=Aplanochytrium stocchinoi TaxID=215587 RepID=A0A7S3PSS7_9STRA|mmetsp:Transcript_4215/g.5295  ORF Transcript_4215/g.5295 Transcript_4215/m.5295 type:complete len:185 (-) Transcript_4215:178-732(-)
MAEENSNETQVCTCAENEVSVGWFVVSVVLMLGVLLSFTVIRFLKPNSKLKREWHKLERRRHTIRVVKTRSIATPVSAHVTKAMDPSKPYLINFSELQLKEKIGVGTFGSVHKGFWLGTRVAIKVPHKHIPKEYRQRFLDEVDLMSKLHHPNIVQFMGACVQEPNIALVIEYLTGGNFWMIHTT